MDFRLLGPMRAEHDGVPVDLGRRRERCFLGLLLLGPNTVVAADRLLDLLWDGLPPDAGLPHLRSNVSRLRARLRAYEDVVIYRVRLLGNEPEVCSSRRVISRLPDLARGVG
jgi:DNA-binding SARP family transcriptional activator